MVAQRILSLSATLLLVVPALAGDWRIRLQDAPLAGYSHYQAAQLWPRLRVGDPVELVREPHNPHDARAIRVDWQGQQLGYLPRRDNPEAAAALDAGMRLEGRISALNDHPDPRRRVRLELWLLRAAS